MGEPFKTHIFLLHCYGKHMQFTHNQSETTQPHYLDVKLSGNRLSLATLALKYVAWELLCKNYQ